MVWKELTEGLAAALRATGLYTPERLARLDRVAFGHGEGRKAPADRRTHIDRPDGGDPAVHGEDPRDRRGRGNLDRDDRRLRHPELRIGEDGEGKAHDGGGAPEPPAPTNPLGAEFWRILAHSRDGMCIRPPRKARRGLVSPVRCSIDRGQRGTPSRLRREPGGGHPPADPIVAG